MGGAVPYEGFFRNIRNATVWIKRHRGRDGTRHFERTALVYPSVGKAGRTRHRKSPLWVLLPPALVALFGGVSLGGWHYGLAYEIEMMLFCGLSLIFGVHAFTARATLPVRLLGTALSLTYPAWAFVAIAL